MMDTADTVTFLFTDIEGSTRLAQTRPDTWPDAQERHHAILRAAVELNGGRVFNIVGDAFCVAFSNSPDALRAAITAQTTLHDEEWGDTPVRVRMGIHTGSAQRQDDGDYRGYLALSRVARLMSAAHGGQVLLSQVAGDLVREQLPPGVSLRDMGRRRLKDLIQPEHIYQAIIPGLPADFPPLKTEDAYRHNLPPQLTRFIGREREIAEIAAALANHRLVTLIGAGGTGKTRLSLRVAEDIRKRYADGVWLVELATLTDPAGIPEAIRLMLRVSEQMGESALEVLSAYLREKQILLILDNCEHLIEASAEVAGNLLAAAPGLTLLATSREALGMRGEVVWPVPSLTVPDIRRMPPLDELARYESVQLFVDRVTLAQRHFVLSADNAAAVAQVCARLDGIPLALEMAAARVRTMGVAQVAARLDDRFRLLTGGGRTALPRQQTLRALLDWSFNLLAEQERMLLRRLAVFAGGWTLEAAESVGVAPDEDLDVIDALGHLVDKSLVVAEEVEGAFRYRMLETTRQYAREMLLALEEVESCRDRHLDYFLGLALGAELHGQQQKTWLDRLTRDYDNLSAAMEWSLESNPAAGLNLAVALVDYWDIVGLFGDGRRMLEAFLAVTPTEPSLARARGVIGTIWFAARQGDISRWRELQEEGWTLVNALDDDPGKALVLSGRGVLAAYLDSDYDLAEQYFEEALALRQAEGDPFEIGRALGMPANIALHRFDYGRAERLFGESLALFRKVGDEREMAGAFWNLAEVALARRDYRLARVYAEDSLSRYGNLGDRHGIATSLRTLGRAAYNLGDLNQARSAGEQSVGIFRELEDRTCLGITLVSLAGPIQAQGDPQLAESLVAEAVELARKLGDKATESAALDTLGRTLLAQDRVVEAQQQFSDGWAAQMTIDDNENAPSILEGLAAAMSAIKQPEQAARLLGAAEALRERIKMARAAAEEPLYRETLDRLRRDLDEGRIREAWAEGRAGGAPA